MLIVIGLALLAFILGDVWRLTQPNLGMASVGTIYGKNVDAQEYQAEVEKYAEIVRFSMGVQNLSETEYAAVKDEVWNNMIRRSLIEKQAEAIGLKVTEAELQRVIETGASPLLASTPFGNEVTGEFDVDYLRSFLSSYKEMDRSTMPAEYLSYYDNLYNFWLYLEDNIKFDLLASKYMSLVENSIISNPVSQKNSYETRIKRADIQLAALPYSTIEDSEITVTKADIKKLYDERKELLYQIAESRDLVYIDYEIQPSQADRNALLAEVTELADQLKETETDYAAFTRVATSSELYSEVAKTENALPADVVARLDSVKLGEVFGPYYNASDDSYNAFKLLSKSEAFDSISYSQIQVVAESEEETARIADSIFDAVKAGADFAEIAQKYGQTGEAQWLASADYEAATYSGDNALYLNTLNSMKKGEVRNLAVSGANIIIKMFDQKNKVNKYNAVIVKRENQFSAETSDDAYNKLSQFVATNNNIDSLKANAEAAGFRLLLSPNTNPASYYIGSVENSHEALRWAFEAEEDAVSTIYEAGSENNHLLLVAVDAIHEKGYRPIEDVQSTLTLDAANDKKAEILMQKFASVNTFAEAMALEGVKTDTVQYVNFTTPAYISLTFANEVNLGASVMNLQREELSAPIKGEGGVYVAQKVSPDSYAIEFDAETEGSRLESMDISSIANNIMQQLYMDADIEDVRYRLF